MKKCTGGVIPVVSNAEANSTQTEVGSYVKYTCTSGYTYIDGDKERITHCDQSAKWVALPTECRSKCTKMYPFTLDHNLFLTFHQDAEKAPLQ